MKKIFFYTLLIIFNILLITAQSVAQSGGRLNIMPDGLGFSNQLEYSYNSDLEAEILENWLNLDYINGNFNAGLRYDVFQPNDPNPSISRGKEKFAGIDILYFGGTRPLRNFPLPACHPIFGALLFGRKNALTIFSPLVPPFFKRFCFEIKLIYIQILSSLR